MRVNERNPRQNSSRHLLLPNGVQLSFAKELNEQRLLGGRRCWTEPASHPTPWRYRFPEANVDFHGNQAP